MISLIFYLPKIVSVYKKKKESYGGLTHFSSSLLGKAVVVFFNILFKYII